MDGLLNQRVQRHLFVCGRCFSLKENIHKGTTCSSAGSLLSLWSHFINLCKTRRDVCVSACACVCLGAIWMAFGYFLAVWRELQPQSREATQVLTFCCGLSKREMIRSFYPFSLCSPHCLEFGCLIKKEFHSLLYQSYFKGLGACEVSSLQLWHSCRGLSFGFLTKYRSYFAETTVCVACENAVKSTGQDNSRLLSWNLAMTHRNEGKWVAGKDTETMVQSVKGLKSLS